jgi:hypothetical protein
MDGVKTDFVFLVVIGAVIPIAVFVIHGILKVSRVRRRK